MPLGHRRFATDVLWSVAGFAVILAAVIALIDAVELARSLSSGELGLGEWLEQVAGRIPGRVVAALPIAGALGAARVATTWVRSGRMVAMVSCGWAPGGLVVAAALTTLLVASVVGVLREVAAPWSARAVGAQATWVSVDGGAPPQLGDGVRAFMRAETLTPSQCLDVDVAWVVDGELRGRGRASVGTWDGGKWTFDESTATIWDGDGDAASSVELVLPSPARWREAGVGTGVDAPVGHLLRAPPSPARSSWLWERAATPLGTALLAGLAVVLVLGRQRWATAWAIAASVVWRLGQGGALAVSARGQWPVAMGAIVPVVALLAVLCLAVWWVDRRV